MFDLTKWYADDVSAEGDFLIGYSARLRYGRFSAAYSSVLDPRGQRHSLRAAEITTAPDEIRWCAPSLGLDATWRRSTGAIRESIYHCGEGSVEWECLLPRGAVTGTGGAGFGYVECLRLTIPPWRLPIRTLRWGRYLSAHHSLIWIDWQGEYCRRSVYFDGAPAGGAEVAERCLLLRDGTRLLLDCGTVIRSGALGSTVLSRVPGLDRIAPARIFGVQECKWLSRAVLERHGEPEQVGWAIHEVVEWL